MTRILVLLLILLVAVAPSKAVEVKTVDFLEKPGLEVNAAGPVLLLMDESRNLLIAANTLTSSLSVIDCATHAVTNIPMSGRAFQHLKSESMTLNKRTGDVYLIGDRCVFVVTVDKRKAKTVRTDVQFESIAVDEKTGNVFVAGRESKTLGMIKKASGKLDQKDWLETREDLINLNATPPPPIRKVIADNALGRIIAVDGIDPMLYVFDPKNGQLLDSRAVPLSAGGRWHYAGYNEDTHSLYLVIERADRKVIQAARIGVTTGEDVVVPLPEFTEGVGILYNPAREEVYVPYDNHPTVHVATFENGGALDEMRIPAFGNDACAFDNKNDKLYVASWARGEVDVVDLESRRLVKRIKDLGIIPHMFAFAFNPKNGLVYYPKGASAVNGTFGAAITALDPATEETKKIYTGWAPIDLIAMPDRGTVFVFNSEDEFAEVRPDGSYNHHRLPFDYPVSAIHNADGDVYLSYGPHQSYWPTVYIWGAKNGVLTIDAGDLSVYDRRIPRQAHRMVLDRDGIVYFTQNNWGKEEQFIGKLLDPVRLYESNQRLRLVDEVQREITQRILKYDTATNHLYLVRLGETDTDPSVLQVVDPAEGKVVKRLELGLTAEDLVFDDNSIYVSNFDSRSVSIIDKETFDVREVPAGENPLKLCRAGEDIFVVNHIGRTLQSVSKEINVHDIPGGGYPNNLFEWRGKLIITTHGPDEMRVIEFDPVTRKFEKLHELKYPFGDTRFDTRNVSFYVRGQFGDVVFEITRAVTDVEGRLWVTDFLSGKLYILE